MIEVEAKFGLTEASEAKLTAGATFVREVVMHDTYLDRPDFSLSLTNTWLRKRNDQLELKIPMHSDVREQRMDQFEELTTDHAIRDHLKLPGTGSLVDDLQAAGYVEIAVVTTKRQKYRNGDFMIDIDTVVETGYQLAEIELGVEQKEDMPAAVGRIMDFAQQLGLTSGRVRGKVFEYIRVHNPDHYRQLVAAGIVYEAATS